MNTIGNTSSPDGPPRKRRWLQFRLRTLLVLVTLVGLWLGWFMVQVQKQRQIVATLGKYNAQIQYHAFIAYPPWTTILPRWLRVWVVEAIPSDDLRRISQVTIQSALPVDEDLEVLAGLPHLRYLSLSGPGITDASVPYITNLESLDCLKLIDSNVTDSGLKHISELDSLETVVLADTQITDIGIRHLQGLRNLDTLYLQGTSVTGGCIESLASIKSLRVLRVDNTQVCGEEIVHLAEIPRLEIVGLQNTPVSDTDLPYLKQVSSNVLLYLAQTKLSDEAAQQLPNAVDRRATPVVAPAASD